MRVLFRADASLQIGTGHVMRCLTFADALARERKARCEFACRLHEGHLADFIAARGYDVHRLPPSAAPPSADLYERWLGCDEPTDAAQVLAAVGVAAFDLLVVDHYGLGVRWETALRGACRHLVALDDLADRGHACDVLLDGNPGRLAADYAQLVPAGCRVLAGAAYALLRPQFAAAREGSLARRRDGAARKVLVTMGGVDPSNMTSRVLEALRAAPLPGDASLTVVLGPHAPWADEVRQQAQRMPWPTTVVANVEDMAALMASQDLAIGAAGVTALERCCLGLPSLLFVLADNQAPGARALEGAGAALVVASEADALKGDLREKLAALLSPGRLRAMQQCCAALVDGLGVSRLMTEMEHDLA